jgi:hypothetical protein
MINKEKLDDEVKYEVAKYSSLFNIFFGAAIFILGIIFTSKIPGYGAPPSRY